MKFLNPWVKFDWNKEKNEKLKQARGVSFEMVEEAKLRGEKLYFEDHHNDATYAHQEILYVRLNDYVHAVPFVRKGAGLFLKTIIPSRKANKKFKELLL